MENFDLNRVNRRFVKVLVVGDSGVGKSALVAFACCSGVNNIEPTIAVDYQLKEYKNFVFNFWDVSGNVYYKQIVKKFYDKVDVVLCVFDVTNRKSFESLEKWIEEVKEGTEWVGTVLVCANKVDLGHFRQVSEKEGENFAGPRGYLYCEVCAVRGKGVKDIIDRIIGSYEE